MCWLLLNLHHKREQWKFESQVIELTFTVVTLTEPDNYMMGEINVPMQWFDQDM